MNRKDLDLPIPYHSTFDVDDSTKLQTFKVCQRKYFLEYVLGWRPEEPNVHLVFGQAWHEAMEILALSLKFGDGYTNDVVEAAWGRLTEVYREQFPPYMDEVNAPKNPGNALIALTEYSEQYKHDDFDVLYTEVAGTAPLKIEDGEVTRKIHFKVDTIIDDEDGFWSLEHKTSSRKSQSWIDQWSLKTQVGTYTHALYCLLNPRDVQGLKINGAFLRKQTKSGKGNDFARYPIRKSKADMQDWLWTTNHWIDQVDWNFQQLARVSPEDDLLMAFPKNTESCTKYGTCKYFHICTAWQNPLQHLDHPPVGFHVDRWDPREKEDEATFVAKATAAGKVELTKRKQDEQGKDKETLDS